MNLRGKDLLYWSPRVLCILFIVLVSLFALDVFNEHLPFWPMLAALGMHLIPTLLMTALLLVSWRWEWVGAVGFVGLALLYVNRMGGFAHAYAIIFVPALLIAALFFMNWMMRAGVRSQA